MLAEKLGIRFYDSELVSLTASRSGLLRLHPQARTIAFQPLPA
ncbi:MAG: hypothetical protein ACLT38_03995 [Akkermansia sp.]